VEIACCVRLHEEEDLRCRARVEVFRVTCGSELFILLRPVAIVWNIFEGTFVHVQLLLPYDTSINMAINNILLIRVVHVALT
jgi:hypothetical protein